uniref:Uncharacterized protein n=1 Tax=viral metagenome TaxID=1070528 RepID=A0A6C0CHX1_9ZZZZ
MEILGGSLNISILAIFYTALGAFLSFMMFHLFDDFNNDWENETLSYQLGDVSLELSIVGLVAFWSTHIISDFTPFFEVHPELDKLIDSYISGLFYALAVFIFLEGLTDKVKFLYNKYLNSHFVRVFPQNWSLMKTMFGPRKTDTKKEKA